MKDGVATTSSTGGAVLHTKLLFVYRYIYRMAAAVGPGAFILGQGRAATNRESPHFTFDEGAQGSTKTDRNRAAHQGLAQHIMGWRVLGGQGSVADHNNESCTWTWTWGTGSPQRQGRSQHALRRMDAGLLGERAKAELAAGVDTGRPGVPLFGPDCGRQWGRGARAGCVAGRLPGSPSAEAPQGMEQGRAVVDPRAVCVEGAVWPGVQREKEISAARGGVPARSPGLQPVNLYWQEAESVQVLLRGEVAIRPGLHGHQGAVDQPNLHHQGNGRMALTDNFFPEKKAAEATSDADDVANAQVSHARQSENCCRHTCLTTGTTGRSPLPSAVQLQ